MKKISSLATIFIAVIISLFIVTSSEALATDFYVSTTGSDTNSGTNTQPFRTLNHAVGFLAPGDTLEIFPGTYEESLMSNIPSGTDWNNTVTVKAQDSNNRPVLRPQTGADRVLHFQYYQGQPQQYIVIDGLVLDGINVGYNVVKITASGGEQGANHIRLINSEVMNAYDNSGILITQPGSDYNEFINLDIHNNGIDGLDHAIYISTQHNLVENSVIHHNLHGHGIHNYGGDPSYNIYRNNTFYNNGDRAVGIYTGTGNQVYNNIAYDNGVGVMVRYGSSNTLVANNTLYGNRGGIEVNSDASDVSIINNNVQNNSHWGINIGATSQGYVNIENNIASNNESSGQGRDVLNNYPNTSMQNNLIGVSYTGGFVDGANYDFHLTTGSSAIDAGQTLVEVISDIDGNSRPQGSTYDIGAYEFAPTSTPSFTPGDANGDGVVDGVDYVIWRNNYNQSTDNGTTDGDFDLSGKVDGVDYVIWLNSYTG